MASTTKLFGYARVSSRDQNEDRQLRALTAAGVSERDIFADKQSGKDFDRPKYKALLACLREGDTVIICSIDRLGRDYQAIRDEWRILTNNYKAHIKVLDMPLLDTTNTNNLDGKFVSDLVLQILSYVAEKERENIRERQRQGIAVAKNKGVRLGRPALRYPQNFEDVYKSWQAGEVTAVKAMALTGLKPTSFYELVKRYEANINALPG